MPRRILFARKQPWSKSRDSNLAAGSLFHRAAYETIRQITESGLFPVTEDNLHAALGILDGAVQQVSAEYASRYSPAILAIWESEVAMIRADLRGWLQVMTTDQGWHPVAAELAFGRSLDDAHDPQSIPTAVQVLGEFTVIGSKI
jgi:hypothetical protein